MKAAAPIKPVQRPLAGPAMKASLFFSAGVFLEAQRPLSPYFLAPALIVFIILLCVSLRKTFRGDIFAAGVLIVAGMFAHSVQNSTLPPLTFPDSLRHHDITAAGKVRGDARFRHGNTYFSLHCGNLSGNGDEFRCSKLLPCVVYGQSLPLVSGSYIRVAGKARKILRPSEGHFALRAPGPSQPRESLAASHTPRGVEVIHDGGNFWGRIREKIAGYADRREFGGRRDLLLAMTVGDVRALTPETRETFTRSGIAHLLAVSGLNVAVVAFAASFLLSFLPIGKKASYAITGAGLLFYAGVCGFQPPIARAFIMSLLVMGAYFLERRKDIENSLFAALLSVLVFDPGSLGGASLQLSFAAVWVLIIFYKPVMALFPEMIINKKFLRYPFGLMTATMLSSVVTAPIAAAHFGLFPFLSLPSNLIGAPLAEGITIIGLPALGLIALGPFFQHPANGLAYITGLMIRLLALIAEFTSRIPFASIEIGDLPFFYVSGFGLGIYLLSRSGGRPAYFKGFVYLMLLLMTLWIWQPLAESSSRRDRRSATFFDVGQGDAAFLECDGRAFLIDTGPGFEQYSVAETLLLPMLRSAGARRLDGVFISHFHADHSGGLETIMKHMPVERIYCRMSAADSLRTLYGDRVIAFSAGDSLAFPGGGMLILAAPAGERAGIGENNLSLVFRFDAGCVRFLFTGDIESQAQRDLTAWKDRIRADILKAPHHGAQGLDREFLAAVRPQTAIISCGLNNRFGHPAESTLSLLSEIDCRTLRTDRDGTVVIDAGFSWKEPRR